MQKKENGGYRVTCRARPFRKICSAGGFRLGKEEKMAAKTIKIADKQTLDGTRDITLSNSAKLDIITKILESGGYQVTRNMAWKR